MKEFIFATNNKHKLQEVREMLDGLVIIHSLAEIGLDGDIPETADTLEGNSTQKVQWVWDRIKDSKSNIDGIFADDTGLEVEALGGRPGVYSARYAGEHCTFDDNINKMLGEMEGKTNRRACFRTVICLMEISDNTNSAAKYFDMVKKVLATTQSSCPTVLPSASPRCRSRSRTASATVDVP